jgi:hypothetical protein
MVNDRVTRGIIAGGVGFIVQNVYIFAAYMAGFTKIIYEDYTEMLFFSKLLPGIFPNFLGYVGHLVWDVLLGIIFAYGIKYTSSRFYLLKGIVYGIFIWWIVNVICTLFRLPVFSTLSSRELGVYLIGALLFGLVVAYTLKLLDTRWERAEYK